MQRRKAGHIKNTGTGGEARVHAFLEEMREAKESTCDNSTSIPPAIREKHVAIDSAAVWRDYLKAKFRFLHALQFGHHDKVRALEELSASVAGGQPSWIPEYVELWARRAAREKLAYMYRVSQLPKTAIRSQWYWATGENNYCVRWCDACETELEASEREIMGMTLATVRDKAEDCGSSEPAMQFEEDYRLALLCKHTLLGLTERVTSLHQHLERLPGSGFSDATTAAAEAQELIELVDDHLRPIGVSSQEHVQDLDTDVLTDSFLRNLALRLVGEFYNEGFDETTMIRTFLLELKKQFPCEVCDYLEVVPDGSRIEWRIATTNHTDLGDKYKRLDDDEIRKQVQRNESYEKGEGISGSVLLQTAPTAENVWRHIGSNDVLRDPRQSSKHRSAYQRNLYPRVLSTGKIRNFWMFPVFVGSRLVGAFRVVNRLDAAGSLQPGGWSYHTRAALAIIADWFSAFVGVIQPQIRSREDFTEYFGRREELRTMIEKLQLEWLTSETAIPALVRHLMRAIARREEEHRLGACIIIAHQPDQSQEVADMQLKDYPFLSGLAQSDFPEPYEALSAYEHAVAPDRGAFVFDEGGRFWRAIQLSAKTRDEDTVRGARMLQHFTGSCRDSVALMLQPDSESIQIYRNGKLALQLYLSERSGKWRFRYPAELLGTLRDALRVVAPSCPEEVPKTLSDAAIYLSYRGLGALIVVGDFDLEQNLLLRQAGPVFNTGLTVQDIGPVLFAEFAKLEGATFVNTSGVIRRVNCIADSRTHPRRVNLGLFPNKGSRHSTGALIAQLEGDSIVIIVSHNRGISLVAQGGRHVVRDM